MKADAYFLREQKATLSTNVAAPKQVEKSRLWIAAGEVLGSFFSHISNTSEPRIWQRRDRSGQLIWHVYDPTTNQSSRFTSEAEVRAWLDQRYYL
ncbi:MAG TPA: hypothetical protein V6C78_20925 [Crinalium sp.]|jgi:hypothetical protein